MKKTKDEMREFIIQITAEKLGPIIGGDELFELEAIEIFKDLVERGVAKIGVMPVIMDDEESIQCITFFKTDPDNLKNEFVAIETGNTIHLDPNSAKVFTLSEDQYQQIHGDVKIS